jgi:hypothetical protein
VNLAHGRITHSGSCQHITGGNLELKPQVVLHLISKLVHIYIAQSYDIIPSIDVLVCQLYQYLIFARYYIKSEYLVPFGVLGGLGLLSLCLLPFYFNYNIRLDRRAPSALRRSQILRLNDLYSQLAVQHYAVLVEYLRSARHLKFFMKCFNYFLSIQNTVLNLPDLIPQTSLTFHIYGEKPFCWDL